jgi:hypothetical protein
MATLNSSDTDLRRTAPRPTPESQPFWDGCARHELVIQQCQSCGRFWFPPSNRCQHCWSGEFVWTPVSGRGELYSFTVYHRAYAAELAEQLPYVVGVVELEEGPRLISNVVQSDTDQVHVGMPVEVVFRDLDGAVSLHAFGPREPDQHTTNSAARS